MLKMRTTLVSFYTVIVAAVLLLEQGAANAQNKDFAVSLTFLNRVNTTDIDARYVFRLDGIDQLANHSCIRLIARDRGGAYWPQDLEADIDDYNNLAEFTVSKDSGYRLNFFVVSVNETFCSIIDKVISQSDVPLSKTYRDGFCPGRVSSVFSLQEFESEEFTTLETEQKC